jgi:ATP-dependent helicase HepA
MQDFVAGQRWINDAELQLGLGTVLKVEHRTVQIVFMATGETRVYAKKGAPLTRVKFVEGDSVPAADGHEIIVTAIHEVDGLIS